MAPQPAWKATRPLPWKMIMAMVANAVAANAAVARMVTPKTTQDTQTEVMTGMMKLG